MTGTDRLRALAGAWDEWGLGVALAEIADEIELERDAEVADSPYDAILPEDREALAWMRGHGGIDELTRMFQDADSRRVELCGALGIDLDKGWSEAMAAMRLRLMPEGYEWPRYESGDLVMFGDCVKNRNGTCTVNSVRFYSGGGVSVYGEDRGAQFVVVTEPVMRDPIRKARPKVFAADGEPAEVAYTIEADASHPDEVVLKGYEDDWPMNADKLTHTKPEPPDSWQRIEEDVMVDAKDYCESRGISSEYPKHSGKAKCEDIVRRCRALAERERGGA